MKRKLDQDAASSAGAPNKALKTGSNASSFAPDLLSKTTVAKYRKDYAASSPYKHAVVQPLISDDLLRAVRQEIFDNIQFAAKETDIYRIFQSGDLANLDGLPESALGRLPCLLKLRDALYSPEFRSWISEVSGAGPLSGKKTDMAINVYKPGCHLLCHDDVIGSRRVSYILYLTDPDRPWKASWGGALRLYPTDIQVDGGETLKVPSPQWSKVIPPAWNQLSFFAVQPGQSFHDVEEVYHRTTEDLADDGGRIRMAISGWFHIPQKGEDGFVEGLEDELAKQSSLEHLRSKSIHFDKPAIAPIKLDLSHQTSDEEEVGDMENGSAVELDEADLDFLLRYMNPRYLTPDTVSQLESMFAEDSFLRLADILSPKITSRLEKQLLQMENLQEPGEGWHVASPPYRHRYLYRQPSAGKAADMDAEDVFGDLLNNFLTSSAFHKWLSLALGLELYPPSILARRFRKGLDYTLATGYDTQEQIEYCLNLTPSKGWTSQLEGDGATGAATEQKDGLSSAKSANKHANGQSVGQATKTGQSEINIIGEDDGEGEGYYGGYELYMVGDDEYEAMEQEAHGDTDETNDEAGAHSRETKHALSGTGGGIRRELNASRKFDPATYMRSAEGDDDGFVYSNPASWNTLSIVLKDVSLKFVKYVSRNAPGDRWDIVGFLPMKENDEEDDQDGDSVEDEGVDGDSDGDGSEEDVGEKA